MLVRWLTLSCVLIGLTHGAFAQEVVNLYEGPPPGSEDWDHKEKEYFSPVFNTDVVTNVTAPTLTVFLPDPEKATGTAVIIAPGGGFHALSINSEGNDVAKWLAERGVAGFVLKYRLIPTGEDGVMDMLKKSSDQERIMKEMATHAPLAGADGLRAMAHVREHADEYGVQPNRIGFMGFSAGGAVTAYVAFNYEKDTRPDFIAPIYAGLGELRFGNPKADAPPMFVVAATDDQLGLATDSVTLYTKWLEAKKSAEMHLYAKGGHGFGMKKQNLPSDAWIERFGEWLAMQGLMKSANTSTD